MNAQTLDQTIETGIKTFDVDASHSQVGFRVKHLGFSKVRGSFEQFEGTVRMSPGDLTTLQAEGTVQANSVTTQISLFVSNQSSILITYSHSVSELSM